ncbi:MAG: lytic transglycosylase domain-containing protein [Pacificimonas sp.]
MAKLIAVAEMEHGLPRGLLDALIWTESTYRPYVISSAGAVGLTQLMPGTAKDLSISDSFHVPSNINGGAKYLKTMFDEFHSIPLALAAYNAGPGNVRKYEKIPPFRETQVYVERVMQRWTQIAQIRTTRVRRK